MKEYFTTKYPNVILSIFSGPDADWHWEFKNQVYALQAYEVAGERHGRLAEGEIGSDGMFWGEVIKRW